MQEANSDTRFKKGQQDADFFKKLHKVCICCRQGVVGNQSAGYSQVACHNHPLVMHKVCCCCDDNIAQASVCLHTHAPLISLHHYALLFEPLHLWSSHPDSGHLHRFTPHDTPQISLHPSMFPQNRYMCFPLIPLFPLLPLPPPSPNPQPSFLVRPFDPTNPLARVHAYA